MPKLKKLLLSTTAISLAIGVGIVTVSLNAPAVAKPAHVEIAASCNPCNPCAAKKACNPCAAKNPCNPCGARNPCAASAGLSSKCPIPSLASANPCNPCAAKNPCAAQNPCNPCAAKNPCAAQNPCNPCAAKNPCNPCGASNPCNPCGASGEPVEISSKEAQGAYNCLKADVVAAYSNTGNATIKNYTDWKKFNTAPYLAATHGGRYLNNYANKAAASVYGKYEDLKKMPIGSVVVKDGITVNHKGQTGISPLFVMEKMPAGFSKVSGDWRYTMITPNGKTVGTTNGKGNATVTFCIECHMSASDNDMMMFLPEELRVN